MLFDCVCDALNFWDWSEVNVFSMGIELDCWMRRNIFRSFSNNSVIPMILLFSRGRHQRMLFSVYCEWDKENVSRDLECVFVVYRLSVGHSKQSVLNTLSTVAVCRLTDNRWMIIIILLGLRTIYIQQLWFIGRLSLSHVTFRSTESQCVCSKPIAFVMHRIAPLEQ